MGIKPISLIDGHHNHTNSISIYMRKVVFVLLSNLTFHFLSDWLPLVRIEFRQKEHFLLQGWDLVSRETSVHMAQGRCFAHIEVGMGSDAFTSFSLQKPFWQTFFFTLRRDPIRYGVPEPRSQSRGVGPRGRCWPRFLLHLGRLTIPSYGAGRGAARRLNSEFLIREEEISQPFSPASTVRWGANSQITG